MTALLQTALVSLVLVAASGTMAAAEPQATASPLRLVSAQRAKAYLTPTGRIEARDPDADVIIVVRVSGLSLAAFRAIGRDTIYVQADDEQLPPSSVASGTIEGIDELKAVFVGPKRVLNMTLVLGSLPPLAFTVDQVIVDDLR